MYYTHLYGEIRKLIILLYRIFDNNSVVKNQVSPIKTMAKVFSIFQITSKLVSEWTWQPANTSSWQAAIIRKRPQDIQSLSCVRGLSFSLINSIKNKDQAHIDHLDQDDYFDQSEAYDIS